jgi:asparagine synthase (glutamine-hydrolysing)
MCGIVGYVAPGLPPGLLDHLLESMVNRGPDGMGVHHSGQLHIGMRRLSIIDLEGGWQPLKSRNGRVVVFQNGEIYNFRELRRELEALGFVFKTESDTEVLAHGYVAWSIDGLLRRVDGMFALAIHDQDRNELHLARDRFGEKPLFYVHGPRCLGFGSTLLSVAALPWVSDAIDIVALDQYLTLHFVPGDRTIFSDVKQLLPGEYMTLRLTDFCASRVRYYQPPLGAAKALKDNALAEALEESIASRLVSDVPIGIFLSGGLDSSIVAALAARRNPTISTFSMGFADERVDESAHASTVAQVVGSRHHNFLFDQAHFGSLLGEVAEVLDTPIGDQALLPLFWLCREAKRYVTVVLSGEGSDELFAGYSYYRQFTRNPGSSPWPRRLRLLVASPAPFPATTDRLVAEQVAETLSGFPVLTSAAERDRLIGPVPTTPDAWERSFLSWLGSATDPLQRATAADIGSWLADDLLVKLDRMAMAHSLEGRAPYLTPRLAEIALRLPPDQRLAQESKVALRRVAARYLPAELVVRPKQGFVLPMAGWLIGWFREFGGVDRYFKEREFPRLNREALVHIVQSDVAAGVTRERFLFAIAMLMEWWDRFSRRRLQLKTQLTMSSSAATVFAD